MDPEKFDEKLQKEMAEKERKQDLFQQRVLVIGELHTQRAIWANQIGQLKSMATTQADSLSDDYRERLKNLERRITEISEAITEFSPKSVDDLMQFKEKIENKFSELREYYDSTEKVEVKQNDKTRPAE